MTVIDDCLYSPWVFREKGVRNEVFAGASVKLTCSVTESKTLLKFVFPTQHRTGSPDRLWDLLVCNLLPYLRPCIIW